MHLIVADDPLPSAGGIQNMAYWLARTLAEKGVPIVVACRSRHREALSGLMGVDFHFYEEPLERHWNRNWRFLLQLFKLRRRLGRDVILYSLTINTVKSVSWFRRYFGWRIVSFLHGNEMLRLISKRPRRFRSNVSACDVIFANSSFTLARAIQACPSDRIVVVHPGIPFSTLSRTSFEVPAIASTWKGRRVVLMLSRIVRRKGHMAAIEAIGRLKDRFPDVLLVIAGTGGHREELRRRVREIALDDHVVFIGAVPEAEKVGLFHCAEVFCMPSETDEQNFEVEGFGIAFLEAAACGVPAVGTRSGGIGDAIEDGRSGLLVDERDVEGLAGAIGRLMEGPKWSEALASYAKERARLFDWSRQVDRMLEHMERFVPAFVAPGHRSAPGS